jgi:hypothetical protein
MHQTKFLPKHYSQEKRAGTLQGISEANNFNLRYMPKISL